MTTSSSPSGPQTAATSQQVVVELHNATPDELDDLLGSYPHEFTLVEAKGFDAAAYTTQLICALSTSGAITALVSVVRAHIASKRHVVIKASGIEVQGLDAKDAVAVIEALGQRTLEDNEHA